METPHDGNHYSVPPAHAGQRLEVRARVGEPQYAPPSPATHKVGNFRDQRWGIPMILDKRHYGLHSRTPINSDALLGRPCRPRH